MQFWHIRNINFATVHHRELWRATTCCEKSIFEDCNMLGLATISYACNSEALQPSVSKESRRITASSDFHRNTFLKFHKHFILGKSRQLIISCLLQVSSCEKSVILVPGTAPNGLHSSNNVLHFEPILTFPLLTSGFTLLIKSSLLKKWLSIFVKQKNFCHYQS